MALKSANMALSFLVELCAIAALSYWGFNSGMGTVETILLRLGAPAVAILIWGLFVAPRAVVALPLAPRTANAWVAFALGVIALTAAGQGTLAWVLGVVMVVNEALVLLWNQRARQR
ncbi:MAG: YrdB family protein [Chloroflexota bacterium]